MTESGNLNRKLRLFFSLRRLPPEFADVERLTLRFAVAAMAALAPILFPGRHYVLYLIWGILITYIGRFIGFILHDRGLAESSEFVSAPRPVSRLPGFLLVIAVASLLLSAVYWAWTTRDPFFMVQSFFGAVTLTYCVGRYWARVAMGLLDILLLVTALQFYFHFLQAGFLAAAAYAGIMVWHFLFGRGQGPLARQFSETIGR